MNRIIRNCVTIFLDEVKLWTRSTSGCAFGYLHLFFVIAFPGCERRFDICFGRGEGFVQLVRKRISSFGPRGESSAHAFETRDFER